MKAGEMKDRFANSFAGDRASIDRCPADDFEFFDERSAFAKLHRLNRRALSRGTGAQHDEVVTFHGGCGAKLETAAQVYHPEIYCLPFDNFRQTWQDLS
jgi:hypothetical protein